MLNLPSRFFRIGSRRLHLVARWTPNAEDPIGLGVRLFVWRVPDVAGTPGGWLINLDLLLLAADIQLGYHSPTLAEGIKRRA